VAEGSKSVAEDTRLPADEKAHLIALRAKPAMGKSAVRGGDTAGNNGGSHGQNVCGC
jgi:hypothetical protein